MSRIFLTGATGFVGARVAHELLLRGHELALLLRPGSNHSRIAQLIGQVTVVEGDMSSVADCHDALRAFGPELVIHAAWAGVQPGEREGLRQFDNLGASLALWDLAASLGVHMFVGLGSQAEYGVHPGRIREADPARPDSHYGQAKLATYLCLADRARHDSMRLAWLRLFSAYGPGDDPRWLLPSVIRALLQGDKPSLTGCGQTWDYLFVDDVATAVAATAESGLEGVFNLGSGIPVALKDVVEQVRDLIDPALPLGIGDLPYRKGQPMVVLADIAALERACGWRPAVPLAEGLQRTIHWWKTELLRNWKSPQAQAQP